MIPITFQSLIEMVRKIEYSLVINIYEKITKFYNIHFQIHIFIYDKTLKIFFFLTMIMDSWVYRADQQLLLI